MRKILKTKTALWLAIVGLLLPQFSNAQNDVMMQAFYWDVPTDVALKNGTWWDNLKNKSIMLKNAGIKGVWVPSPAKGNFGIYDMGYGIFDHYDLGNYNQKGTTETRFGSRLELEQMISAMHANSIDVYADIVLNHIYTNEDQDESNPVVKQYAFAMANGHTPYPTDEIKWVIKNAAVGDYYLQVQGYHFASNIKTERGYDLQIDYAGSGLKKYTENDLLDFTEDPADIWHWEPNAANNNGGGVNTFGNFPASGDFVRGHIEAGDVDEFKFHVSSPRDVVIKLTARREASNPQKWAPTDQTQFFYPGKIWNGVMDIAPTNQLEAHTNTHITYVNHNGPGEANVIWDKSHFHPADNADFLENDPTGTPDIIPRAKLFGNDVDTYNPVVKQRYKTWGSWLATQLNFDGFRLDFTRGFQPDYVGEWAKSLPLKNGSQRFVVSEYWSDPLNVQSWVNAVGNTGADVDAFDFPLKFSLNGMCNGNQNFNMADLNHVGMVRNNNGNALSGTQVVTWLENHDTGKEHDKWVSKDWKMGYAYILTHEGRPCIFYNHYFGDKLIDKDDPANIVTPDAALTADIEMLMFVRKTYLNGTLKVLSDKAENVNPLSSNPFSPDGEGTSHVYVARRQGNGAKEGAIVVINNHDSAVRGLWVDTNQPGFSNWANAILVNAFNPSQTAQVQADGSVLVSAPARGYTVYVKQSDYVAAPPFSGSIHKDIQITQNYSFTLSDFPFAGVGPFTTIKIVSTETEGDLEFNGVDVVAGGIYNLAAGSLVFKPDAKLTSTFTFQVRDANMVWSNNSYTATITVHCTAPSNLQTTQLNPFEATFTWSPVQGVPSYELQYQENGAATWSTWSTNATSMKLYNLDPGISYQAKVTSLCYSSEREFSNLVPFQTPEYCKITPNANKNWIDYVKLDFINLPNPPTPGFIDNKSGSNGGYIFFKPTYGPYQVSPQQYALEVTPDGQPVNNISYKAWIDYNHDGKFSDIDERIMNASASDLKKQSNAFTIPAKAQAGTTVMRVSMAVGAEIADACSPFSFGEVEDYRITIKNGADSDFVADKETELIVSPNPGGDQITVNGDFVNARLEIFDSSGALMGSVQIDGKDPMVDLSKFYLRSGNLYYIRQGIQTARFLRK
jgi:alpha-amylase